MSDVESFFSAESPPDDPLRSDLIAMIRARDAATPRHLQRELGPSDVAHPCMRRMAYGLMGVDPGNPQFDPLPSIIGTATHAWLASAAAHANMVAGRTRWITETRVNVAPGLAGSCDLYDCDTATVLDWKVVGNLRFAKYRKDPGPVYRNQVFLYGKGFENAGRAVKTVAIAFLPRGKTLHSLHVWSADYDPAVADAVLKRRWQVMALLDDFKTESRPESFAWFPRSGPDCEFCNWWSPNPTSPTQCAGAGDN